MCACLQFVVLQRVGSWLLSEYIALSGSCQHTEQEQCSTLGACMGQLGFIAPFQNISAPISQLQSDVGKGERSSKGMKLSQVLIGGSDVSLWEVSTASLQHRGATGGFIAGEALG